ncbi:unnamed protein product [Ixodes pacificus]
MQISKSLQGSTTYNIFSNEQRKECENDNIMALCQLASFSRCSPHYMLNSRSCQCYRMFCVPVNCFASFPSSFQTKDIQQRVTTILLSTSVYHPHCTVNYYIVQKPKPV